MKLKILLVKYFDRVILACLALLLVYGLYRSAAKDTTIDDLDKEIAQAVRVIEDGLNKEDKPVIETEGYLSDLRRRLERPPVLSEYSANPFFPAADILMTRQPVQIPIGQAKEYLVKRTTLEDVIEANPNLLKVEFAYVAEDRGSKVIVTGVESGAAQVRIRDDRGRIYVWNFIVLEKAAPPNAPRDVVLEAKPAFERGGVKLRPARVLITFRRDDPPLPTRLAGLTTYVNVYRKFAEEPNVDFKPLTRDAPLRPLSAEDITQLGRIWTDPVEDQAAPPTAAAPVSVEDMAVPKKVEGPLTRIIQTPEPGTTDAEKPAVRLILGEFGFLDTNVEEGESYTYRIETVSAVEGRPPVVTQTPYEITGRVPALVNFEPQSLYGQSISLTVTRLNPTTNEAYEQVFRMLPGMVIGGVVRVDRTQDKSVDFSTNCIAVDSFQIQKNIRYRVRRDLRSGKYKYKARATPGSRMLYLSPSQFLREKEK